MCPLQIQNHDYIFSKYCASTQLYYIRKQVSCNSGKSQSKGTYPGLKVDTNKTRKKLEGQRDKIRQASAELTLVKSHF